MLVPETFVDISDNDILLEKLENSVTPKVNIKKEVQSGGIISDLFDKDILSYLESVFNTSISGSNTLTAQEFKDLIVQYIPLSLVETIYRAIDVNDMGYVNYSDFTNYLISSEAGTSFSSKAYTTRIVMVAQQEDNVTVMHRDFIDCLVYVKKPCPMLITGGRDGQISLWDPSELTWIKNVHHRGSNSVYQEDLHKSMDTLLKAQCSKYSGPTKRKASRIAITAMCPLLNSGLLCVGSADCCVTIYELGNQEVCGRFTELDCVPTAIECFCTKQQHKESGAGDGSGTSQSGRDTPLRYISVGDSNGNVHLIRLHQEFEMSTEVGMKKKNQLLFAQSVKENCTHKAVHTDWIAQMRFISEVDALVTASADGTVSFLDVSRGTVQKVFVGHKESSIGAKTFSWSAFSKYIVSGGDRSLLFWDPFTLEVIMTIDNFRSPLVAVEAHDAFNKVFAALSNKSVHIWHNITFELLQVVTDPSVYKPTDNLSAMAFAPDMGTLFTAGNRIAAWKLERSSEGATKVDDEDLVAVLYNPLFHQVVLVKSLGLVKVYQAETGEIVRQFKVVPLDSRSGQPRKLKVDRHTGLYLPVIKHACFDKHQTRLIVAAFDLSVQLWNINDGVNLLQLHPQLYSTTLAHVYANLPRAISTLGYEVVRTGEKKTPKKLLLLGTEHGNICGYHETNSSIDDVPVIFLRVSDNSKNFTQAFRASSQNTGQTTKESHLKHLVKSLINVQKISTKPTLAAQSISSTDQHLHELTAAHRANDAYNAHNEDKEKLEKDRLTCTDAAVLWTKLVETKSLLMVAYASGLVTFWDLERCVRTHDLPLNPDVGPVLIGMKRRSDKGTHSAAVDTAPVMPGSMETAVNSAAPETLQQHGSSDELAHFTDHALSSLEDDPDKSDETFVPEPPSSAKMAKNYHTNKRTSVAYAHKARTIRKATLISLPPTEDADLSVDDGFCDGIAANQLIPSNKTVRPPGIDTTEKPPLLPLAPASGKKKNSVLPFIAHNRRDSAALVVSMSVLGTRSHSVSVPKKSISLNPTLNYGEVHSASDNAREQAFLLSNPTPFSHSQASEGAHPQLVAGGLPPSFLNSTSSLDSSSSIVSNSSSHSLLLDTDKDLGTAGAPAAQEAEGVESHAAEQTKIVVDCLVVLLDAQVLIGACSDKYMRFWDLNTHDVLCSCCYYHRPEHNHDSHSDKHGHHRHHGHTAASHPVHLNGNNQTGSGKGVHSTAEHRRHHHHHSHKTPQQRARQRVLDEAPVDEVLRHLTLSDSEDLLIGAYDNGMIRLWSLQSYSIVTLRSLLTKHLNSQQGTGGDQRPGDAENNSFGFGLAISPITLLFEWTAHSSPIVSIEYLWFNYEAESKEEEEPDLPVSRGASRQQASRAASSAGRSRREKHSDMGQDILEGYIVSAGVDQKVYMWSVQGGKCVGEFGSFGWDINSEATWLRNIDPPTTITSRKKSQHSSSAHRFSDAAPLRMQTSASMITRDSLEDLDVSHSSYVLRTIGRHQHHTTAELNSYVEELTKRMINKPPAYTDVAGQFNSILAAHPMVAVTDRKTGKNRARTPY